MYFVKWVLSYTYVSSKAVGLCTVLLFCLAVQAGSAQNLHQVGLLSLVAGKGAPDSTASRFDIGDGGLATKAQLINPFDAVSDMYGNLFILDTSQQLVRKVNQAGIMTTIAGTGHQGYSDGQGVALDAHFSNPTGLTIDVEGNLYVADTFNHCVYQIAPQGIIKKVAGTGTPGFDGDGEPALQAQLFHPTGLFITSDGVLYIADQGNHRIRKVTPDGLILTVAGTGNHGFGGDGGLAIDATLADPTGVWVGADGTFYIADRSNHRIRKVMPSGHIETIVGNGVAGFGGDGNLAIHASINIPSRIVVDRNGYLYIADRGNSRIRRVDLEGRIHTVLGGSGEFQRPVGLSLSGTGELIISDTENHVVHKVLEQSRSITLVADRLEILGNGQEITNLLAKVSGNLSNVPMTFGVVDGTGVLSVLEAHHSGGYVGTQFTTQNPGRITIQASMLGALPVSVELNVLPVHQLTVAQSAKTLVANGANTIELEASLGDVNQGIDFELKQGTGDLVVQGNGARLSTTAPGLLTVLVSAAGALPVSLDIWAVQPKPWQVVDKFEFDAEGPLVKAGQTVVRSFHNKEDIDEFYVEIPQGHAIHLATKQAILAKVFDGDGELHQTLQLPGEVFSDNGLERFRIVLTGAEGAYEIEITERATHQIDFSPQTQILIADGFDQVPVRFSIQDRFGQRQTVDNHSTVHLSVVSSIGKIDLYEVVVKDGIGEVNVTSNSSGVIEIQAAVEDLKPRKATVVAIPALILKKTSSGKSDLVEVLVVAGSDMLGVTGVQARVAYDPQYLGFEAFNPEGIMENAKPLLISAVDGAVEINVARFDGPSKIAQGVVGRLLFRTKKPLFQADDLVLLEGHYGRGSDILPFGIGAQTSRVVIGDRRRLSWTSLQAAFGSSVGERRYEAVLDLNKDGKIDFADFLIWSHQQSEE